MTAHEINVAATIARARMPDLKTFGKPDPIDFSVADLAPRKDAWDQHEHSFIIPPSELEMLYTTKESLKLDIDVTFYDGFSIQKRHYCYAFFAARTTIRQQLMVHTTIKCEDLGATLSATKWNLDAANANERAHPQ